MASSNESSQNAAPQGNREEPSMSMKVVIKTMKSKWPKVENVSTDTLQQWIEGASAKEPVVILDTRPEEEYVVSHIKDAIRVDPDANDVTQTIHTIKHKYPEAENIKAACYCSLGYRSSKYADAIQNDKDNAGSSIPIKSYNVEGSLFKWANEGRPMVDSEDRPTHLAHPYSMIWGKLLKYELRSYTPQHAVKL